LKEAGFNDKGETAGGYREFEHEDKSKIYIRPDGEVVRTGPKVQIPDENKRGYRPRVDQHGKITQDHSTGEIVNR